MSASSEKTRVHEKDAVEITEAYGEWFVRIVQNGCEHVASFEIEAYARAYAEGQRLRLGLPKVGER